MVSEKLDFCEFLSKIENLKSGAIHRLLNSETHETSQLLKSRKTAPLAGRYKQRLNQLEHILQENTKPTGMLQYDLLEIRPIILRLVNDNELPRATLDIFE